MPLIYSSTQRETSNSRMLDIREALSNSLIARESRYHSLTPLLQRYNIESSSSSSGSSSSDDSNRSDTSDDVDDDQEEEEEDGEEDEDDTTTVTESFTRSRVDMYRLAIRSNSEILEDLAAIIRILRQINTIYRVFNNNNSSRYLDTRRRRRMMRRRRIPTLLHHSLSDDDVSDHDTDEDDALEEEEEEDEEANKLLEAGLEDLQAVLTMENTNSGGVKRQSTLALLALITYQQNHCSDKYLQHYLDPNGEYCRELSIFAAATYDEEEEIINQPPKSCKDIIFAAEEIYGSNWLDEFHQGKEGALRKMLDKLTFVAQIRSKIRSSENLTAIR